MERYLTIATLSGIPVIRDSLERPELSVGESEAAMDMRCHVPVVGRNHHGETRTAEASQDPGDSGGVVGVQRTRRLIRQNHGRTAHQAARDRDALLFTAGQRPRQSVQHRRGESDAVEGGRQVQLMALSTARFGSKQQILRTVKNGTSR